MKTLRRVCASTALALSVSATCRAPADCLLADYTRLAQMLLNGGVFDGRRYLTAESVGMMSTIQTGDLVTGFTPGNGWEYASSADLRG